MGPFTKKHFVRNFFNVLVGMKFSNGRNLPNGTSNDPSKVATRYAEIINDWSENNIIIVFTYLVRRGFTQF